MSAKFEKLYDDLYMIKDMCNCYLLLGAERAMLVDTGVGLVNIIAAAKAVTEKPVAAVNTHAHIDHFGNNHSFDDVLVHKADEKVGAFQNDPVFRSYAVRGIPMPARAFLPKRIKESRPLNYRYVDDGETIDLGGKRIRFVHTPGHTPGSCCLFDDESGYMFGGDTLVPRLALLNLDYCDTPQAFKGSMLRLKQLHNQYNIRKVFPGHHVAETDASLIDDYIGACEAYERGEGFLTHDITGMKKIVRYGKVQIEVRGDA